MTVRLLGSKRNFINTVVAICVCFCMTMVWSVCSYLILTNKDYKITQSRIIGEQYQMLYEQERNTLKNMESIMDASMIEIMRELGSTIRGGAELSEANLLRLSQLKMIAGIWIIEQDKLVRISSEGGGGLNAADWYRDRPDIDWDKKLDSMLKNQGETFIDTFSKREEYPHEYIKWGYMGIGYVPQLGGTAVLEIGISLENAYTIGQIKATVEKTSSTIKNIVGTEFVRTPPSEPLSPEDQKALNTSKTYVKLKDDGNVEVSLMAEDFSDSYTQIVITTTFPDIDQENRAVTVIAIGATAFLLLCLFIVFVTTRNKKNQ